MKLRYWDSARAVSHIIARGWQRVLDIACIFLAVEGFEEGIRRQEVWRGVWKPRRTERDLAMWFRNGHSRVSLHLLSQILSVEIIVEKLATEDIAPIDVMY